MTDLASLVVKLEAETSQYTAAIQKATEQMGGFAETVGSAISDVAKNLLALEALKQVFDFTEKIVNTVANFEVLSHALGGTTESLSQLSFAAKLFNVEDISFALERLARSVGAVETGNQKTIDVFKALGVSIYDTTGKLKTTEQQMLDISDAVTKYNDGLSKTAAVQQIFGRSGADFIAFLDQGSKKIKEAQQEAIDLGVSISSPAAKAAHEFQEDMTRIGAAFQGIFFRALQELLPTFKALTEQIIEFAKNAENTQRVVDGLVAGFKIIGTVLVGVGAVFEAVGQIIGAFAFSAVTQVNAVAEFFSNVWQHPLDSAKNFANAQQQILSTFKDSAIDAFKSIDAGGKAIESIWDTKPVNAWGLALDEAWDEAKKKPDLHLIDEKEIKLIEKAIEALANLDTKLKQEIASYGLSGAAAIVYDVTLGKLSASVDELDKKSPKEVKNALEQLEKQGKVTRTTIEEINAAIKAGVPPGEAYKNIIIDEAEALDRLKGVDLLSKLDSQLLTMTGHLEEAAQAAFDLANRPLLVTIQTQQNKTTFSGLDDSHKAIETTSQLNALRQQATAIEDALGKKVADVDAATAASGETNLQVAGEEAVARQGAIAQLEALYVKAQALANATGLKSAVDEAKTLQSTISKIQFNPKILQDVEAATLAQKRLNETIAAEKSINDDLALQLADLNKQNVEGSLTDLDYMAKQDEARQKEIDQLKVIQEHLAEIVKNNPGNAQALDQYKKLGVEITNIQTQMGQLAKTIRNDLVDDLTNAFVGFASGAESGKKALQSFVADFGKQMLQLGAKQLFQKLFETTGISGGIDTLFGGASKAAGGIAGSTAAATTISTAMTTAATAGSTALGTGITTGATAGATELGTGITTAATAAATEMATVLEASGTTIATAMATAIETAGSAAAAAMGAAITAAGAASGASSGLGAAVGAAAAVAAGGGQIQANQLTLVGEQGPELFVSDLGSTPAALTTKGGTDIPDDLAFARVIGAKGPEYIQPGVSGFVVPSDTFLRRLGDRTTSQASALPPAGPDVRAGHVVPDRGPPGARDDAYLKAPSTGRLGLATISLLAAMTNSAFPQPTQPGSLPDSQFREVAKAAQGGPVYKGQTIYIGEQGPELLVSDAGGQTAVSATRNGTQVPRDLGSSQLIGVNGPRYMTPTTGGFIIPTGVLASQLPAQHLTGGASFYPNPHSYTTSVKGIKTPIGLAETFTVDAQGRTSINEHVNAYVGLALPTGTTTASGGSTITANDIAYPPGSMTPSQFIGIYEPNAFRHQQLGVTLASYAAEFSSLPETDSTTNRYTSPRAIPAFADGGHFAGGPMLVGEHGPEILVPSGPGTVIPNSVVQGAMPAKGQTLSTEPLVTAFNQGSAKTAASITSAFTTGAVALAEVAGVGATSIGPDVRADQPNSEVIHARAFETPTQLDQPTSTMLVKFEKIVKHEQPYDMLDAREYETLLTDRYLQKRQGGGPVSAGKPYLVGESGPELMVPDSSGAVMNSWDDSQSNNRSTTVHMTNNFLIQSQTGKIDRASQGQIATRTGMSVQAAIGRNG